MLYIHNYINVLIASYKISTAVVFCAAVGCCSESGKSQDISFNHLLYDQTLKAKWLQKLKRDNRHQKKILECVTFILKMNLSDETWRYLIIYCEEC